MVLKYLIVIALSAMVWAQPVSQSNPPIIPLPNAFSMQPGSFVLNRSTAVIYSNEFPISSQFLIHFIQQGSSIPVKKKSKKSYIKFLKDPSILNPEGYSLHIQPTQIILRASTDQGAFYAVQSLRQLMPVALENGTYTQSTISIPCMEIKDEPRFSYRGMHLDVVRHFFPVDFIKKYIDALALLKMNRFHWHLTDDQGWRIEIEKYPLLNQISSYRKETLVGHYTNKPETYDGIRYGGFYTQEEIKEVVAYAQERFITIIPEIEMPGHAQAVLAAYPELGCTGEPIETATSWGVFPDIFCPKEETFTFLEDILEEVMALFPGTYIHIGGDEAPKDRWKESALCQELIQSKGLKDEHELQSYFISRIEKYLNAHGRQIIGWDEILEGGLAPNATVMSWRGLQGAIASAQQQHYVIMTPTSYCYFDYYQSQDKKGEPIAIGGYLPLGKVYNFNPIPKELTPEQAQYILGAQGNLWTEYIPNAPQVEYMLFPRILAMSEVDWTYFEKKNFDEFLNRIPPFYQRLDALGYNYSQRMESEKK